jgi:hypothetical protein
MGYEYKAISSKFIYLWHVAELLVSNSVFAEVEMLLKIEKAQHI